MSSVRAHLEHALRECRSPDVLSLRTANHGDWWRNDPTKAKFQIDPRAAHDVWGVDAQYVYEGGTMALLSFVTKTLKVPDVHVPLGQSSDGAHLPNEQTRAATLFKGQQGASRHHHKICKTKKQMASGHS